MLYADYRGESKWASEFPREVADANTCKDGLEHYPRCPECGGRVTHRNQSQDGRVAHFAHCHSGGSGGGGGVSDHCDGATVGESEEHKAMKSIAASTVEFALESVEVAESQLEAAVPAPSSDAEQRQADCLLSFTESDEQLGKGLIIEVQYRNKTKDKTSTTIDYIKSGYSVLWLWEKDFHTTAELPENWSCKLVHEKTVRDRVRRQIWPLGGDDVIWSDNRNLTGARAELEGVAGLSSDLRRAEARQIHAQQWINEVAETSATSPPDAKIAGTAVDELARQYKESIEWERLFTAKTGESVLHQLRREFNLPQRNIPVKFPDEAIIKRLLKNASWPEDWSPTDKIEAVKDITERFDLSKNDVQGLMRHTPPAVQSACPHCWHSHDLRPVHSGEITRGKTCRGCGEWFTVFSKSDESEISVEVSADE